MGSRRNRSHLDVYLLLLLVLFLSPPQQFLWGWADSFGANRGIAVLIVAYSLIIALTLIFARIDRVEITIVTRRNLVPLASVLTAMSLLLVVIILLGQAVKASSVQAVLSLAIPSLLFVGFGEELAYRGYVQNVFVKRGSQRPVLIAAVLFALYHVPVDLLQNGFSAYVLALLVPRIVAGLIFGIAYQLAGEIGPSVALHGFYDTTFALISGVTFTTITLARFLPTLVPITGFLVMIVAYKVPLKWR